MYLIASNSFFNELFQPLDSSSFMFRAIMYYMTFRIIRDVRVFRLFKLLEQQSRFRLFQSLRYMYIDYIRFPTKSIILLVAKITFISKIFWNSEDFKSGKRTLHCFTKSLGDSIGDITIFNIISAFAIPVTTTCLINNIKYV